MPSFSKVRVIVVALLVLMGASIAQASPHTYLVANMGTTSYGIFYPAQNANCLNYSGQVVGGVMVGSYPHAAIWSNGTVTDLGTLPGYPRSYAVGINDAGQVVGYCPSPTLSGVYHTFVVTGGVMTDITPAGWKYLLPDWINNNGIVLCNGNNPSVGVGVETQPYLYNVNTGTNVSPSSPMLNGPTMKAINDSSMATGANAIGNMTAFAGGTYTALPNLSGYTSSLAVCMNALGCVAGTSNAASGAYRAFYWRSIGHNETSSGTITAIPFLGTGTNSLACGINGYSEVVGQSDTNSTGNARAFFWDTFQLYQLDTQLASGHGYTYQLWRGYAINDKSQIVVSGVDTSTGTGVYVLLTPQ